WHGRDQGPQVRRPSRGAGRGHRRRGGAGGPRLVTTPASSASPAAAAAVIFDWGGTITPWHDVDLHAQWTAFADGAGTVACARNDLAAALYDAESPAWQRGRSHGAS